VRGEGEVTGMGSIHVVDRVGYVDDMLTLPAHRRRGIASAVVRRLVHEAADQGAEDIILLADRPDPIRLYRSLGFEERLRLAGALSRLGGPGQARGSSGSEVGSTAPPAAAPGAGSPHGVDPG
jgi:ribosomal protein S18 acetylase RimI-like enzyme